MNCLLIYPRFPPSFFTSSDIIQHHIAKALHYPLGLLTMAALLPEDWQLRLVDLNVNNLTEEDWEWAEVVMLSGMHIQKHGLHTLLREAKQRQKTTICGGPYASLVPEELLDIGCDYVVWGEAENSMEELFSSLDKGQTGKLIRTQERCDLKTSPIPRFELVSLNDYQALAIQTTRGCPYSCEFCEIASIYGRAVRWKSPDQVISEIERLYELGGFGHLFICDDNFIGNRNNAKAICKKIIDWNKKHSEPFAFVTQVTTDLGQDLEMIDLMTAANFSEVLIGIESIDDQVLAATNKYHNVRNPLVESITAIKENGLSIIGSFILGFDNEEAGAGKQILRFVEQTDIPTVIPNLLTAMPKTKLWERLKKEGRLLPDPIRHDIEEYIILLPNFVTSRPIEEIIDEHSELLNTLYEPSRFFERTYRFCLAVRPTRQATAGGKEKRSVEKLPKINSLPFLHQLYDIKLFLLHIWTYGVVSPIRSQFWKQLFGMYKHNPSRLPKYVIHCIQGHEMLLKKDRMIRQLKQQLSSRQGS